MGNEEIKAKITELWPTTTFDESGEWLNIIINPEHWLDFATRLRNDDSFSFDYLFCLTCVDFKTHLTMVYHLSSTRHRHNIVVKSTLHNTDRSIETVSHIWQTANFHEREVYEMFGVNFYHHPDLRLLILPDGWEGKNPMLKDFEDPVNMIRL